MTKQWFKRWFAWYPVKSFITGNWMWLKIVRWKQLGIEDSFPGFTNIYWEEDDD